MKMFGPVYGVLTAVVFSALVARGFAAAQQQQDSPRRPAASPQMRSDARLNDVCFVDARHGWAVGALGTIWHTADGGGRWRLQPSGIACNLTSVCFLDENTGWAAGRMATSYSDSSRGIVLSTADGGRSWRVFDKLLLPGLAKIRFFDTRNGWAVGDVGTVLPAAAFKTKDGGRSWRPLGTAMETAKPRLQTKQAGQADLVGKMGWDAADFIDRNTGAVAGRMGRAAVVRRGVVDEADSPRLGMRGLKDIVLVPPSWGWLIGDGGLVMMTGDLGLTWQTPPGELPDGLGRHFDFEALAVRGPKCWLAGAPGTRVFVTDDAGQSWRAFPTGHNLPIRALTFVDDQNGWAVGAMGTILATSDGGQTWKRQRSGGARAAVLGLFSRPKDVPLELFARLSADEGYLGVVEVLNRRDIEVAAASRACPVERFHQAMTNIGLSDSRIAWRFPLRQPGLNLSAQATIDIWNGVNDGRGFENLQAHLVRQIRLWRPKVIVTHGASPRGDNPGHHLINQAVLEAARLAADPTSHARQITEAGLEPWDTKKIYAALDWSDDDSTRVAASEFSQRLGCSPAELAAASRELIDRRFKAPPETPSFRLMVNHLPQDVGEKSFFSGIALQPGGEARRQIVPPSDASAISLRQLARRRRNVKAVLARCDKNLLGGKSLLAEVGELMRDLSGEQAGRVLFQLADSYRASGRWEMAAEVLQLLVERYPAHPLAETSLVWLLQYHAGAEADWRLQGPQRKTTGRLSPGDPSVRQAVADDPSGKAKLLRKKSTLSIDASRQKDRMETAARLGKLLERAYPEAYARPSVRFPLAVVDRMRGLPQNARRFFMQLRQSPAGGAWSARAKGEEWLAAPKGLPPVPVIHCLPAGRKPRLDGILDDAVWQQAGPVKLTSDRGDDKHWPAKVMLARDDEFLYLALECRQAPGAKYGGPKDTDPKDGESKNDQPKRARTRDADLSAHDRVDIFLDIDRDHASYYHLTIDHRGWPAEDCWGDKTWNPSWFVAAATKDDAWRAEAAIPLDQLTGRFPIAGDAWAVGIQRTVPGVGFQSWNKPASTRVCPQGFGYLVFH
ncbi:MAG: YCF48-related protein [Planctomycetota bacterium]|nr:YCF48-related protein [Planctomycetota bacterium]